MKRSNLIYLGFLLFAAIFTACNNSTKRASLRTDTPTSGITRILVDESMAQIVQRIIDVFEGTYPEAKIIPVYTSERESYNLLEQDSARLLIGTRDLTKEEKESISSKRRDRIKAQRLAVDGIALIVNKNNVDTLIKTEDIRKIMTGEITKWKELDPKSKLGDIVVVFDMPNSSTAKFISDSITNKAPFGKNVGAIAEDKMKTEDLSNTLTANEQVIEYVRKHENALGIVGVNWISNPEDPTGLTFAPGINVMSVSNGDNVGGRPTYYKPYPAFLGMRFYPLSRDVYIIITESQGGLPSGFVNFAAGEKGQRIISKSGLFPATIPTRVMSVKPMSEL